MADPKKERVKNQKVQEEDCIRMKILEIQLK